jgi:hypothetical protein
MFEAIINITSLPPTVNFCETPIDFWIRRPFYFISNLPYIALGFWLVGKPEKVSRQIGFASIFIGLASSNYDATYTLWAQLIDLFAMFWFVNFLLVHNLSLRYKFNWRKYQIILSITAIGIIFFLGNSSGQILFALTTIASLISFYYLPSRKQLNYKPMYIAVALLIIGFLLWIPDRFGLICFEFGLLNGRSLFHLLTTVTIYFVYQFYEENKMKLDKNRI